MGVSGGIPLMYLEISNLVKKWVWNLEIRS